MEYEWRICCFVDILGFKNHLDETLDADENDRIEKIALIHKAIDLIHELPSKGSYEFGMTKMITQFSDSIVISFKIDDKDQVFQVFMDMFFVAIELANNGFLTRGGITYGKLIHTEKVLFGPAMVDAYVLESKKAIYPRIIIDKYIFEIGENFSSNKEYFIDKEYFDYISLDDDGLYYIDYISKASSIFDEPLYDILMYLAKLKAIYNKGLLVQDQKVITKMNWLKNKINSYIDSLIENSNSLKEYDVDSEIVLDYRKLEKL